MYDRSGRFEMIWLTSVSAASSGRCSATGAATGCGRGGEERAGDWRPIGKEAACGFGASGILVVWGCGMLPAVEVPGVSHNEKSADCQGSTVVAGAVEVARVPVKGLCLAGRGSSNDEAVPGAP